MKGNYADRSTYGGIDLESDGVLVCTIEKANQTITGLLEEENMGHLSCIVVDELHMVRPFIFAACGANPSDLRHEHQRRQLGIDIVSTWHAHADATFDH